KMMSMRPSAAAYARVSYARELKGDLNGAFDAMQLAAEAAAPQDLEAQAWYSTQLAELCLKRGQLEQADREYRHASFFFPNYPLRMVCLGKVKVEQGRRDEALEIYLDQFKRTPTLDLASRIGDLYAGLRNAAAAERYYQLAEDVAGPGLAQTE